MCAFDLTQEKKKQRKQISGRQGINKYKRQQSVKIAIANL